MEPITTTAIGGIILLVINGGVQWIREWKKSKVSKTNGDDLHEIKEDVSEVKGDVKEMKETVNKTDLNLAKVEQSVKDQKVQCGKTVTRFDEAIRDQGKEILKIAGGSRRS